MNTTTITTETANTATTDRAHRRGRFLATALLVAGASVGSLVAGASAASAADSCGSGWHKESDGKLSASVSDSRSSWGATASLSGYVRYCTRERTLGVDQKNQRVYVGIPNQVLTTGKFAGGGRTGECLTTKITINAKHIPDGSSITIGFDGRVPTGSVTSSYTDTSKTVTYKFCATSPSTTTTLENTVTGLRATVPNCGVALFSPVITSVTVSVTASLNFRSGGTEGQRNAVATNTDKSTWSTFSC